MGILVIASDLKIVLPPFQVKPVRGRPSGAKVPGVSSGEYFGEMFRAMIPGIFRGAFRGHSGGRGFPGAGGSGSSGMTPGADFRRPRGCWKMQLKEESPRRNRRKPKWSVKFPIPTFQTV